jgi:serine/threonine protein kinase
LIGVEGGTSAATTRLDRSARDAREVFSVKPLQDEDLTGRTVDHYAVVALIAAGGQGRVYRARDKRLHRDVALKVGRPGNRATRHELVAEARMLSLINHPHIAAIHDCLVTRERACIVMEFVPGATLRDVLAGGPLPPCEVARLGADIARGLAAAHAANVVHGDIKPSNLKITTSGQVKILDFGVAKMMPAGAAPGNAARPSCPGSVIGTVPYMAPEQLRGDDIDGRTDIFSLGTVLYEMATGRRAFPQVDLPRLIDALYDQDPPPATMVNPHVPLAIEAVIAKAMRKDRSARQQSAIELAESLEAMMPHARRSSGVGVRTDPRRWSRPSSTHSSARSGDRASHPASVG